MISKVTASKRFHTTGKELPCGLNLTPETTGLVDKKRA